MTPHGAPRHALVFGASGLIGRHLMLSLAKAGAGVTAAVRSAAAAERVMTWMEEQGHAGGVSTTIVDFNAREIFAGGPEAFGHVTEIHNCAGSYRFGMTEQEARETNVGIVEHVIRFAGHLPELTRVLHVSGYRVGGQDPNRIPWPEDYRARTYAMLGAYEASKMESDAIFQKLAQERGLPWSIVNPSAVIGDSVTGASDQYVGLPSTIEQIWKGTATALPGGRATFLPVVTVDYLASFMAAIAVDPEAVGQSFWVLDDNTPPLAELLTRAGHHMGAKIPRLQLPVSLIKRLPSAVTKADPETLSFMSSDRYPTGPAIAAAKRHGLRMPDVDLALRRWVQYLVAHRFGAANTGPRRFVDIAGARTFEVGVPLARKLILPGLPVNADTWAGVAESIGGRAVDLPGLGLSGGVGVRDWERWLPALLDGEPVDLVGHSLGAAAAVLATNQCPDQVKSLTLIAPFFLQAPTSRLLQVRQLVAGLLRGMDSARLSHHLTGSVASSTLLESSVTDLRRSTAHRVAAQLALTGSARWRTTLTETLGRVDIPVRIITGSRDPLLPAAIEKLASYSHLELISIPGAGHHPQLTHADELAELLK
ncbi:alpha/beta fold hydrolase [Glutamicibacter sp. PS]|uniref:alpha/beta fold hydrolase n=1 Tax=Glutamicibacter sp. PS TaxID=3075634 RepID=UPI002840A14E|nr:alpha/beta fold hydrolase [Glutamicibacter sp. PS]MDR4532267.1 alpha/beta fold hydrolase [Glutamicibacter sp. PS]